MTVFGVRPSFELRGSGTLDGPEPREQDLRICLADFCSVGPENLGSTRQSRSLPVRASGCYRHLKGHVLARPYRVKYVLKQLRLQPRHSGLITPIALRAQARQTCHTTRQTFGVCAWSAACGSAGCSNSLSAGFPDGSALTFSCCPAEGFGGLPVLLPSRVVSVPPLPNALSPLETVPLPRCRI